MLSGIKSKVYIPLIAIFIISVSYIHFFWLPLSINNALERSRTQIQSGLDVLGEGLVPFILEGQLSNIYETLDELKSKNPNWKEVILKDSQGRSLYPLDDFDRKDLEENVLIFETIVKVEDEKIGKMTLFFDATNIIDAIKRQNFSLFLTLFLGLLFCIALSGIIIQRKVIGPLVALNRATIKVSQGDFNLRINAPSEINDEVSQLVSSFLSMKNKVLEYRGSLESRNKELKKAKENLEFVNRNLEDLVDKRTKELESARAHAINRARLASLGEMASGIAHEINNPVAIMDGQLRRLQSFLNDKTVTEEKKDDLMVKVQTNLKRVVTIIEGIKKISRKGEGDGLRACQVLDIFESLKNLCYEKFKNNSADIEIVMPETEVVIMANETQVLQVLMNLINNGYDAIKGNNEKWVKVEVEKESSHTCIRVSDSGNGIPEKVRENIFDPFFTTKEVGEGTGIGLSISKKMIEDQNGELKYELYRGNTSFVLTFKQVTT